MQFRYGAGGLSISPSLTIRGFVFDKSPAFALLDGYSDSWEPIRPVETISVKIYETIENLGRLFAEGKASPSDVDSKGDTLMHVGLRLFSGLRYLISTLADYPSGNRDVNSWCLDTTKFYSFKPTLLLYSHS